MLSVLQEKLGEAHGLAMAAATVTEHVQERTDDAALYTELRRMREDAEEARARCLAAEGAFASATADEILAHANTIKEKAGDMLGAWFKAWTGPLAAWSFLAMGEAGELSSWTALSSLAEREGELVELAAWGVDVQRRHLDLVLAGTPLVAELFEPAAPRWG